MCIVLSVYRCSGSMAARPFAIPLQTSCVGDTGRSLDIHSAKDLFDSAFNPAMYCHVSKPSKDSEM